MWTVKVKSKRSKPARPSYNQISKKLDTIVKEVNSLRRKINRTR